MLHNPPGVSCQTLCGLADARLATISRITGTDPVRLRAWSFCGIVMSICWSVEDESSGILGSWTLLSIWRRNSCLSFLHRM